jgi:PPOX class probable F420-dependent enzyme
MPKPPLPAELDEMLSRPNPSVIGTLKPDGSPHTVATWYLWKDGRVLVNMDASRKRLEYIRKDPRVSLTVLDEGNWYHHVSLRGRVASLEPDTDLSGIDSLSRHYTGQPYSDRDGERVNAWIEVESWHAWDVNRAWTASTA